MADINKKFEIEVVLKDGEAKAKIKGVTKEFVDLGEATKILEQNTRENTQADEQANKVREGSYNSLVKQRKALEQEQAALAKDSKAWKSYTARIIAVDKEIMKLTGGMITQGQANKAMISNTGLAGATITELGRTVSDSAYGIQGMGNNISQLASLFTTFVSKTEGGLIPALRQLGKSFIGPLGIVVAIQAAVAMWERYDKNQKKAEKSGRNARNEAIAMQSTLLYQVDVLEDVNTSEEERAEIISNLKKEIPSLKDEEIKYGESLDVVRQKIIDYTLAQANRAEMHKLQQENQELLVKRNRLAAIREIENADERLEAFKKLQEEFQIFSESDLEKLVTDGMNTYIQNLSGTELREKYDELTQEIFDSSDKVLAKITELAASSSNKVTKSADDTADKVLDLMNDLRDKLDISDKEGFEKRIEQTNIEYANLVDKIEQTIPVGKERDDALLMAAKLRDNKQRKIVDDFQEYLRDAEEETAKLRDKSLEQRDKNEQKFYKDNLRQLLNANKQELAAEKAMYVETAQAELKTQEEVKEGLRKLEIRSLEDRKSQLKRLLDAGKITAEQYAAEIAKIQSKMSGLIVAGLTGGDDDDKMTREEQVKSAIETAQMLIDELGSMFDAQFDAEISREEAKTAKINNELAKRLNNEKLTAKQREQLNLQIQQNEIALQEKRDEIAEKNFKLQKAVSIGNTLISTYEMAAKAYKALAGIPVVGPALGNIAAIAASAFGLAQVRAISQTQFVPSSTPVLSNASGASNAPSQVQAPDFNIVGASGANQLRDLIEAQSNRPMKTYVVSKDISTAQELDRNKVSSASL